MENIENNFTPIEEIIEEKKYSEKEVRRITFTSCLWTVVACLSAFCLVLSILFLYILKDDNDYDSNILKYLHILELYDEHYISDIDMKNAIDYSIAGLVTSMDDKYGAYIPAGNEIISSQIVSGNYYGVGVTLNLQDTFLEVIDIVEDSPAGRSELKIGDCITKINDEPVSVEVYKSFREKLNKKEIKEVKFEINREKEIFIHLGDVKEKKVDYFVEDDIAYITVSTFVMDSISEFKDAVDFAVKENVSKIVFDLRNNSGGDVDAVSAMLDYILGDCLLIDMQYSSGQTNKIYSDKNTVLPEGIEINVVVNGDSASASELFVMALQDNYGIELIGQTTYGKSTVLKYFTFKDGSLLSMSVGTYYSNSGRYIEGVGITPDIYLTDKEIGLPIKDIVK